MKVFRKLLESATAQAVDGRRTRRWVYVPYDQLTDAFGPLAEIDAQDLGIVLVESPAKAGRRPYHKQKLFLVLANQRRFALEQASRGVRVDYRVSREAEGYVEPLERAAGEHGTLLHMEPAERELRVELGPLVEAGLLEVRPHQGWLTTPEDFVRGTGATPPWRMDRFYRHVRRATGILMEGGDFEGGQLSFDGDNRERWPGQPAAPAPPTFRPGDVEEEVAGLIRERYSDHPGVLDPAALPTRPSQVERLWTWALEECLEHFGPFEDAMARAQASLFHTRVSPLLHLQRLTARRVVDDVARSGAPLQCREGFVRQVLGWREFVRHVHRATDGFREIPGRNVPGTPGAPSALGSTLALPGAFWGATSGLDCLDVSAGRVLETGYGHHIERLMVLSNVATLLDVSPRELTDWFWSLYVDAYDWVVEPNVLGMGTFGVGDVMTTKPYISGAAYIDRMGDFCADCAFDPKRSCPITRLYWAFLARHADGLDGNHRIAMPLRSAAKRDDGKRAGDRRVFEHVRGVLDRGERLTPEGVARAADGA